MVCFIKRIYVLYNIIHFHLFYKIYYFVKFVKQKRGVKPLFVLVAGAAVVAGLKLHEKAKEKKAKTEEEQTL